MTASGLAGKFVSRKELADLDDVFLLNLGSKEYLLSTKKRLPGTPRLIGPIVLLVLGVIVTACPVIFAVSVPEANATERGQFRLAAVVLAALFLFPVVVILRKYGRERRFDQSGHLLPGVITDVSAHERSREAKLGQILLRIFLAIVEMFSIFDGSGLIEGLYTPGDFYEVTVAYTAITPSGTTITGTAQTNRPDLRKVGLPGEGSSVVLLYLDDRHYKVM